MTADAPSQWSRARDSASRRGTLWTIRSSSPESSSHSPVTYHYLFPQLTMGLAFLIFILKTAALRRQDELYNQAARFWSRIFAVSFIMGVVTGIPLEFEFGTNWARFSAETGSIIAQLLAMEGAFAFFLESAFVGLPQFGEQRFGQRVHWAASLLSG
jgi:cytochrome d ubiquinol oxidase subunit I